ncbi:MAG: hypothetical protein PF637_05910 [Spirochaetes bacterium]|jgi:hypothetical protein|nr:hypothetical protein [Spirochaetota bacterium]
MTAEQAVLLLCEEYNASPTDGAGNPKIGIQYRIKWIRDHITQDRIEWFVQQVLLTCKSEYLKAGMLPSLAAMAEIIEPKLDELLIEGAEAFNTILKKLDRYKDFATDNKRLQAGLISVGGWKSLCASQKTDQKYLRERFANAYAKCNLEKIELRRESGIGSSGKLVFIGTETGRQMLEEKPQDIVLEKIAKIAASKGV